jgi:uncharacterized membrane protein HdeD (DUF308 family)
MEGKMSYATHADDLSSGRSQLVAKWGWFVALGVALLILGLIAFGNLVLATLASVWIIGALMLVGGVAHILHAFQVKSWGSFLFWLLSGLIYAVAGILTFTNPLLAAAVLTLILGVALLVSGLFRVTIGLRTRPSTGWGWLVASGIVSVLAGLVVALGWPVNTLVLLGLVLAIDLTFQGIAALAFGFALKAVR